MLSKEVSTNDLNDLLAFSGCVHLVLPDVLILFQHVHEDVPRAVETQMQLIRNSDANLSFKDYVESVAMGAILAEDFTTPVSFIHHHLIQLDLVLPRQRVRSFQLELLLVLRAGGFEKLDVGDHVIVHILVVLLCSLPCWLLQHFSHILDIQRDHVS